MDELTRLFCMCFAGMVLGAIVMYPFGYNAGFKKGYERKGTEVDVNDVIKGTVASMMDKTENVIKFSELNGDDKKAAAAAAATVIVSEKETIEVCD